MISLLRFSHDGFESKIQSHHYRLLQSFFEPYDYKGLNEYQIRMMKNQEEENRALLAKLNLEDWRERVFVFVDQLPEPRWIDLELNHLKSEEKLSRKLYTAKISGGAEIYSVYNLIPELYTVENYLKKYGSGAPAFVPKRSLDSIQNIQQL